MFKYEQDRLRDVAGKIVQADVILRSGASAIFQIGKYAGSPSFSAVVAQYSSYLGSHPGSLTVATKAATENVRWLHDSLDGLIKALDNQEKVSVDAFTGILEYTSGSAGKVLFLMRSREEIPVLDLGYVPPIAAIEAATPLKALTAMFAGDDSGITMAAHSWTAASKRMLQAAECLQSAAALIAGSTEGTAFDTVERAMTTVAEQCTIVAANSTAMATSMLQLPPIRAAAHAQLIAMEAEIAAEAAAAGAVTGGAGAAAIVAKTQAQVAAFVAGYLQPALDTARPLVSNLSVPVVNHTGGGTLTSAGAATKAAEETITQVAGGAATPAATQAAAQPNAVAPQAGHVGATPAGVSQAAPVGQAPSRPTGGTYGAPGGTQAASPASMPAGQGQPLGPVAGRGTSVGTPGTATPGTTTGLRGGTGGSVAQPLLPRGVSATTPRSPGAMPVAGPGSPSSPGAGAAHGGAGTRGGAGGMGGAAPANGNNGSATQRGGAGGMAGAGAAGAAGQKGAAGQTGKGKNPSALFGKPEQGSSRHRRKKSVGSALLDSYFRREYLGDKETTVKKVIR